MNAARKRAMVDRFDAYLSKLRETPLKEHTEHTGRSALEALLNQFAPKGTVVQHEPKRKQGSGTPDFKVRKGGTIVGYVEVKPIGEKLGDVLKSDQMERYRKLSDNIILT